MFTSNGLKGSSKSVGMCIFVNIFLFWSLKSQLKLYREKLPNTAELFVTENLLVNLVPCNVMVK